MALVRLSNGLRTGSAGVAGFGGVNTSLNIGGFGAPMALSAAIAAAASRNPEVAGGLAAISSSVANVAGIGSWTQSNELVGTGALSSIAALLNGAGALTPFQPQAVTGAGVLPKAAAALVTGTGRKNSGKYPYVPTFTIPVVSNYARVIYGNSDVAYTTSAGVQVRWSSLSSTGKTRPSSGDVIKLANGTHGPIDFQNFFGKETNPIVFVGATTESVPTIVRRYDKGASWVGGFVLQFNNCHDVVVDGWNPSIGTVTDKFYGCGLKVMFALGRKAKTSTTAAVTESCSAFIKVGGTTNAPPANVTIDGVSTPWTRTTISDHIKFRYIEIDGGFIASRDLDANFNPTAAQITINPGIGFGHNDQNIRAEQNLGRYREKTIYEYCYVHNCRTEAMYIGPNYEVTINGVLVKQPYIPSNGVIVRYNRIEDSGWDAINGKSWYVKPTTNTPGSFLDAPLGWNVVHGNIIHRSGQNAGGQLNPIVDERDNSGLSGIPIMWSTVDVFDNIVIDSGGQGIYCWSNIPQGAAVNGYGPHNGFTVNIWNNVVVRSGWASSAADPDNDRPSRGIAVSSGSMPMYGKTYNNTIIGTVYGGGTSNYAGYALTLANGQVATNNILINNAASYSLSTGSSQTNNWLATGQTLSDYFETPGAANSEVYDYHLKAAAYVTGKAKGCVATYPTTDLDGATRNTVAADISKGAYEYGAAPPPPPPPATRVVFYDGDFSSTGVPSRESLEGGGYVGCKYEPEGGVNTYYSNSSANTTASNLDCRVLTSETWNGEFIAPRSGTHFMRQVIYYDKQYECLNGSTDPDLSNDNPRVKFDQYSAVYGFDWDTEMWFGFSIRLPSTYVPETGTVDNGSASLIWVINEGTPADLTQLTLARFRKSGDAVEKWWLNYQVNASAPADMGLTGGTTTNVDLGLTSEDAGLWTDFVIRVRFNPFTVATNPAPVGGKNQTYQGNRGILQVWKGTGPYTTGTNRAMVRLYNRVNLPVGGVPAAGNMLYPSHRIYKYGWKRNTTTSTAPIYQGFDAIRWGFGDAAVAASKGQSRASVSSDVAPSNEVLT